MMRMTGGILILLVLPLMLGAQGETQNDLRKAHGTFTGEIKPVLFVRDVAKSAPYYRNVLGFDFQGFAHSNGEPYYAEMAAAGVKFGLHEPMSKEQETKVGQERLYFRVKDLLAHRSRIAAWGGQPGEIKTTAWMDMFTTQDPDGNEIVFAVTDPQRHTTNPWNTAEPTAQDTTKGG